MSEQIEIKDNTAILAINPKLYALETIYSASYVFLDKVYILLEGDPQKEIIVKIKPKKTGQDLNKLALEFFNELINYSDYKKRSEKTKEIREMILQRAIITNDPNLIKSNEDEEFENLLKELEQDESDDSEEVIVPWE